jgi:predicted dienelactone hydrolase
MLPKSILIRRTVYRFANLLLIMHVFSMNLARRRVFPPDQSCVSSAHPSVHLSVHRVFHWLRPLLGIWVIPTLLSATPSLAAEHIYISYGVLERSISVNSLEIYARQGKIEDDLLAYTAYATPEQLQRLRTVLLSRADVSPVILSRFLYTSQGEALLRRLGELIQTGSRQTGFLAIRSALILAADDPEGLTPLNVLRKFPVSGIRIDVERTLAAVQQLEQLINQSNEATATIERLSAIEAASNSLQNFSRLADLRRSGQYVPDKVTIPLEDLNRNRSFKADIYFPASTTGALPPMPAPLIVISHGLGSDRTTYGYLANHLASYGFAVAVIEHPGSNAEQLQALIEGRANEVNEPSEFIDRPLDIKFLLDDLAARIRSNSQFRGRIDLQRVGIIGQSLGAYTALVLGGATINLPKLQQDCSPNMSSFNLSLLLQCRALKLPQPLPDLQDNRIKAIIAINPIGSSLLGETGFGTIRLPTMMVSGTADTVAPSLLEQIIPFTWLTTPNRYLLLIRRATHFSTLGDPIPGNPTVDLPPEIIGPERGLARRYLEAISVAFFKTYVANDSNYRPYLGAGYVRYISQDRLPVNLVRSLTPTDLTQTSSK